MHPRTCASAAYPRGGLIAELAALLLAALAFADNVAKKSMMPEMASAVHLCSTPSGSGLRGTQLIFGHLAGSSTPCRPRHATMSSSIVSSQLGTCYYICYCNYGSNV